MGGLQPGLIEIWGSALLSKNSLFTIRSIRDQREGAFRLQCKPNRQQQAYRVAVGPQPGSCRDFRQAAAGPTKLLQANQAAAGPPGSCRPATNQLQGFARQLQGPPSCCRPTKQLQAHREAVGLPPNICRVFRQAAAGPPSSCRLTGKL